MKEQIDKHTKHISSLQEQRSEHTDARTSLQNKSQEHETDIQKFRGKISAEMDAINSQIQDEHSLSLDILSVLRSMRCFLDIKHDYTSKNFDNDHGHSLLMSILSEQSRDNKIILGDKTIIEIGSTRERLNSQKSTEKLAVFTALTDMNFITVDMDPENTRHIRSILPKLNARSKAITQKGEDFLAEYNGSLDFIYLDAYDFFHENHSDKRRESYRTILNSDINDSDCWEMHRKCAEAIISKMPIGGIVVIDDTWLDVSNKYDGKGKFAAPLLLENGFIMIAKLKMAVALKRS